MSRRRIAGVFVTIVSAATGVLAPIAAGEALNPRTYLSPSGEYRLFVDPTTMTGAGPGRYRLLRAGQEVWTGERPVTLRDAVVTDEGVVAGYGYEGGVQDTGHHGLRYAGLTVVILDGAGHLRMRDAAATHESGRVMREWSGSDSPAVSGIVVDPASDRFLVSIRRRGGQDRDFWWSYRLSSGESLADFAPDHPPLAGGGFVRPVAIRHLPGTPLVLVQWYVHAVGAGGVTKGAVIALLDVSGRELWSLGFPGEYDGLGEKWDLHWDLIKPGYVQLEVEPAEFSFRSYSLASRVTFSVAADPGADAGWRATETGRVADRLESGRRRPGDAATEPIELVHAGTIRLQGPARADSPIDNINEFAIDAAGNLGFVRWNEGTAIFVLVDLTGRIITNAELGLPQDEQAGALLAVPVTRERWVLLRHSFAEGAGTRAWWMAAATGAVEPIEGFECGSPESLASGGDGGFLVLSKYHLEYTIQDELARYDGRGHRLWGSREPGYGHGFSFQAATCLPDGSVAALTHVRNTIEFCGADGKHRRSLKLADVLGKKPNYPAGLEADAGGGLILHDFNGTPPVYRIDAGDKVIAALSPQFPDGRRFVIRGDVRAAPDGALWTSDGHALLRLDGGGIVDRILGPRPDEIGLDEIRAMTVDREGRIYAVDGRTAAVHVFGTDGVLLRTCTPEPTDFASGAGIGSITIDGEGGVYYLTDSHANRAGYLHFSQDCRRIGFEPLRIDRVREQWLFKPGTRERWVLGYRAIHLLDEHGDTLRSIERRPDGNWIEHVQEGAVGPDGSLALIASPDGRGMRGPAVVNVYRADGEPIRSIPLVAESIFARVAFNGSIVATTDSDAVYLYDLKGGRPRKASLPADDAPGGWWHVYFSPDGAELWLRGTTSKDIQRYRIP